MITEYELYSDERRVHVRQTGGQCFFLGGVVCTDAGRERLLRKLAIVRGQYGLKAEMKWAKISRAYLAAYKAWVDTFFQDPFARYCIFKIDLSSDSWASFKPRSARRSSDDDRTGSAFYQFLLVTFGPLRDTKRWWVYPDVGLFSHERVLNRVEFIFNRTYKAAFGPKTSRIIRLSRSRDSAKADLLQLADVLLGALSFRITDTVPDSAAKLQLVQYCNAILSAKGETQRGLAKLCAFEWVRPEKFSYRAVRTKVAVQQPNGAGTADCPVRS